MRTSTAVEPRRLDAPITYIEPLEDNNTYRLAIEVGEVASEVRPGQFIDVLCCAPEEFSLRRPFSVHGVDSSQIKILFGVVGKGTRALSRLRPGDLLDVLGPLGNGYRLHPGPALLVGGGLGIAPLYFLAQELFRRSQPTTVLVGAGSAEGVFCVEDLERLGCRVHVATEDGSAGHKGLVTGLMDRELDAEPSVYACGPEPMLRAVWDRVAPLGLSCQVSLETPMACGVGACLGCARPVKRAGARSYERVCVEGPVFEAGEVFFVDDEEGGS